MSKPYLLVVTGRPGSGKTTLAHLLAKQIHCPAFCRDEFKEGFVNTMGRSHSELDKDTNRIIYEAFFEIVTLTLSRGISVVAEAAFQHKLWEPKLTPLMQIARIRIVVCTVDAQLARNRFIERGLADPTREKFHGDPAVHAAKQGLSLPLGEYDPPKLPMPTLMVETSDGYQPSIDAIVEFIQQG